MIQQTESTTLNEPSVAPSVKQTQYSIEPIAEGPRVKPKRQLSEKQLKALEQGRKRLAETRRIKKESVNTAAVLQQMEKQLQQKEKEETQAKKQEEEKGVEAVSTNSESKPVAEEPEETTEAEEPEEAEEGTESNESNESNESDESSDDELEEIDYNLWCSIS